MLSTRQWCLVTCLFVVYLLFGTVVFYYIESNEEEKRFREHVLKSEEEIINHGIKGRKYENVCIYCDTRCKLDPSGNGEVLFNPKWDFYRSLFFVISVISTIGYGNLSPMTAFSRIFMIFYALIGIPLNGIVMVNLGKIFGRQYTKLYRRWKTSKMTKDTTHLSLITQIIIYLVPGFTIFIFIPSAIIANFEGWPYWVAVYHSFVTLSTIGFGDFVAGAENNQNNSIYILYQIFLIVWVITGLGYLLMILNFITRGMGSKKMQKIEEKITQNLKKTPTKIRQELESLLKEFLFQRVKRVYRGEFNYIPRVLERRQSCPDLTIFRVETPQIDIRKRTFSDCFQNNGVLVSKIKNTNTIKQKSDELIQQTDLILKVVDAIGGVKNTEAKNECYCKYDMVEDQAQTRKTIKRSVSVFEPPKIPKIKLPNLDGILYNGRKRRPRTSSEPVAPPLSQFPQSLINRFKHKFTSQNYGNLVEYQEMTSTRKLSLKTENDILEQTSIADLIRALSSITTTEEAPPISGPPKRKLGNAGLEFSTFQKTYLGAMKGRNISLMEDSCTVTNEKKRRSSLRSIEENF